jgi:hypothetical protein
MLTKDCCVGLFGTCGKSTWRKPLIAELENNGIGYFNPQVDGWTPEFAQEEAHHLINDDIVLFPVTGETYGTGSLAEVGFSINTALKSINEDRFRFLIVMIDHSLDAELMVDAVAAKESIRSRALVMAHLSKINHPNVFVAESFNHMTLLAVELAGVVDTLKRIK